MQGDTSATEDSHDDMFSSVPRRTGANKIRFTLGSTRSRTETDDRIGDLVTSTFANVAIGRGTKVQEYCYCRGILVLLGNLYDICLVAANDDLFHDPNKIFGCKTLLFGSLGLSLVSITDLLLRTKNIRIDNSSQMLLFSIANKPLLANMTKGVEVSSGASGQRTCPEFKSSREPFKVIGVIRMAHPVDRFEIASSEFYIFGDLKEKWQSVAVTDRGSLIAVVTDIFSKMNSLQSGRTE
jgi:hypothetical protein